MDLVEINYNESPLICKQHDGTIYERTGYCCQCGQCCVGCKMLIWITENERGICGNRVRNEPQECNQDVRTWPNCPEHIIGRSKCTYKFKLIK